MAKFAKVGYGSDGRATGKVGGYVYIVNDNVRTGDKIQVISTSKKERKFATTAVPIHTYKETSSKGKQIEQEVKNITGKEPTKSYTGRELKAKGSMVASQGQQSAYTEATRAGNIEMYKRENPNAVFTERSEETFDSYSEKFMNRERGERQWVYLQHQDTQWNK